MGTERFARIDELFERNIAAGVISGAVALVERHGEIVYEHASGWRDIEAAHPMRRDTLFRIASMSKPVTVACAMTFVDEGKLRLDDPVDEWLPELANRPVLRKPTGPLDDTVPMERPITLRDLCTHRSGYMSHGAMTFPLGQAMAAVGGLFSDQLDADEFMMALGQIPLLDQPGARYTYGISHDILGVMLGRVAGQPLADVVQRRIAEPLGMTDTAFHAVDPSRLAVPYTPGSDGKLVPDSRIDQARWHQPPRFAAGAGGMVSSAHDYLRFGAMLLRGGAYEGTRVLSRRAVELMRTNHLTERQRAVTRYRGTKLFFGYRGYGLGVEIVDDLTAAPALTSLGAFGWGGYFGTWWHSFPVEDLVAVMMIQVTDAEENLPVAMDFQTLVMAALD